MRTVVFAAIGLIPIVAGCRDLAGPPRATSTPNEKASLAVAVNLASAPNVAQVRLRVTAADLTDTLWFPLSIQPDGVARATADVPAGTKRTFTLQALDTLQVVRYEGSATVDVVAGQNPPLTIVMQAVQQVGQVPIIGEFETPADSDSTAVTGLDFPGNVNYPARSPSILFVFNAAISGTAPFPAYPATYIFRVYPRANVNYWSSLFHANYTSTFTGVEQYYGMHPYPDPPPNGAPRWEISSGGGDNLGAVVGMDQWYTQVVRVTPGFLQTYYWNWPNTTTDVVRTQDVAKPAAPNPAIIVGDAPWNRGAEVYSGVLRGFQFYDVVLTDTQIQQEIANPGSVRRPWYLNLNPTPSDISDKSGNGHNPAWVGSNRPTLWTP